MKKKMFTLWILLCLMCLLSAAGYGQRMRNPRPQQATDEIVLTEREHTSLAALSTADKTTLSSIVELLLRSTLNAKNSGFSEYRTFIDGPSGTLVQALNSYNKSMEFLPDGILKTNLQVAWEALNAAWVFDREAKGKPVVDRNTLVGAIDKYNLNDRSSPAAMSANLLVRAEKAMITTAKVFVKEVKVEN